MPSLTVLYEVGLLDAAMVIRANEVERGQRLGIVAPYQREGNELTAKETVYVPRQVMEVT